MSPPSPRWATYGDQRAVGRWLAMLRHGKSCRSCPTLHDLSESGIASDRTSRTLWSARLVSFGACQFNAIPHDQDLRHLLVAWSPSYRGSPLRARSGGQTTARQGCAEGVLLPAPKPGQTVSPHRIRDTIPMLAEGLRRGLIISLASLTRP